MVDGSHKTIWGKRKRIMRVKISMTRNGIHPLKIVPISTSGKIPLMTYTLSPRGGVISDTSMSLVTNIPNQIPLNPRDFTTGNNIGNVRNNNDTVSKNIPNGRYTMKVCRANILKKA